ncbi:MAG: hypothetical protein U0Q55_04200 [Vicinamibacterales bacterium]
MPDQTPPLPPDRRVPPLEFTAPGGADAVACERCRTRMHRVRAAWHCPACGHKTDGYGW